MWNPWRGVADLAAASNERAVANARSAATACAARRVERADVELYLTGHAAARTAVQEDQHPA